MRFDDRLATVLRQPARDSHDRAVRWRQLVDLVARAGAFEHNPVVGEALEVIAADAGAVPDHLRAAAARAVAAPSLPFELVRYFAGEAVAVAVPVLSAVQLNDDQWRELLGAASPEARRVIGSLHPGLEPPAPPAGQPEPPAPPPSEPAVPSIGDVVARIERLREERHKPPARTLPQPPAGQPAVQFRWECDSEGIIGWVEGAPRGALVGRSIARREGEEGVGEQVERAFASRAPFREAPFELGGEGPASGRWKISGIPAFSGGRFVGYRGIATREQARGRPTMPEPAASADPQSLRELVHELKTPLNAIIGFAEIIEAQMLGSADERYRARAGEIVAQGRLLLAAIDDLDLAARLQSDRSRSGRGVDLAALLDAIAGDLAELAGERGALFEVEPAAAPLLADIEPALAERLVRRFCGAVIAGAQSGEQLHAGAGRSGASCRIAVSQPRALAHAGLARESRGPGLELRLVRGLARMIGGDLTAEQGSLQLAFPAA